MSKRLISILIVAGVIALLAGCGGVAQDNPDSRIASLHDGSTTYEQAIASLGKPYQDYGDADGSRTVVYMINQQQASGDTHIPVLGPYAGHISQVQNKLTLKFDPNGTLVNHSSQITAAP
ncbi:MAG: hypothetical protein ACREQR_11285 [Candidatus Binataceae bacterium]